MKYTFQYGFNDTKIVSIDKEIIAPKNLSPTSKLKEVKPNIRTLVFI
jgi:hypothetical protein